MKWWKGKDLVEVEKMKAASPARKEIEEWVISNNVTLKKNESYTYVYGETEKVTNTKGGHLIWIEIYVQDKVLRTYAEMENVMDRTRREAENSKKFAIQVWVLAFV